MKMNRFILLVAAGMIHTIGIIAQTGNIVGEIVDQSTKMVVPFGGVQLSKNGKIERSVATDIDGKYKFEKIPCGTYSMKVNCVGYDSLYITDVIMNENRKLTMNLTVSPKNKQISEIIPIPLYVPKRDTTKTQSADSITVKIIKNAGQG